jgi:hypothetical protein
MRPFLSTVRILLGPISLATLLFGEPVVPFSRNNDKIEFGANAKFVRSTNIRRRRNALPEVSDDPHVLDLVENLDI